MSLPHGDSLFPYRSTPNGGELRHEKAGGSPTGEHDPVPLEPLVDDVYALPNLKEYSAITGTTMDLED